MTPAGLERCVADEAGGDSQPVLTLLDLVRQTSAAHPHVVAIRFCNETITYADLEDRSSRLARSMRALGACRGVLVALLVERSPAMVVALLAILKAGAAYVPLDPTYPAMRLQAMLDDAAPALLVSESPLLSTLDLRLPANTMLLDQPDGEADAEPLPVIDPEDTAYVIFTSGSTGRPKGVEIAHRALVNLLCSLSQRPGITRHDTLLAVTSIAFDIAAAELFLPLIAGACIELASREEATDAARLLGRLVSRPEAGKITILQATPVTWRLLILAGWQGSPALSAWCGGEEMTESLARDLLARAPVVWNLYGPTETTIWSTCFRLERAAPRIPLGEAIANTSLHILDENQRELPDGLAGELCVAGAGLAKGYRGRPDLTRQSFPTLRLDDGRILRLYRTGDRVRRSGDGALEFLGRLDRQVKLRGFRIELAEIEHAALQCPGVQQAAVIKVEDPQRGDHLAAFAVPGRPDAVTAADLRNHLAQRLPASMVPASIRIVAALPVTPNGKLDRSRLAMLPDLPGTGADTFDEPRDGLEQALARLWSEALTIPALGRDDNFFGLGGDSLLAAHLETAMAAAIDPRCAVGSLLRAPTIAAYAAWLQGAGTPTSVLLHPGRLNEETVFWVDNPDRLPRLASLLAPRPFYSMLLRPEDIARHAPFYPLESLARSMVEHILHLQPAGRFVIGGFCQNALLAFEVACQLDADGYNVPLLVMIDPGPCFAPPTPAFSLDGLRSRLTREWFHVKEMARISPAAWPAYLRQRYQGMRFELEGRRWQRAARDGSSTSRVVPELAQALFASRIGYRPKPYPGSVLFIEPDVRPGAGDASGLEAWRSLTPKSRWRSVPGGHLGVFAAPSVESLATEVAQALGANASACRPPRVTASSSAEPRHTSGC